MSSTQTNTPSGWSLWSIIIPLLPTFLAIIGSILTSARDKRMIDAGIDQEIAKQSERIFELTETGRKTRERIEKLDDGELNDLLAGLGSL